MADSSLTIWCNASFVGSAYEALMQGVKSHRLIFSSELSASNLAAGGIDTTLGEADVAFGQPYAGGVIEHTRLKWAHLTTAGYTRYDTLAVRQALAARGAQLTNSSRVYAEPCAEHVLAFMMAHARQLPQSLDTQRGDHSWPSLTRRASSRLLLGQEVVLLGFGAIGRRVAELLAPFGMRIRALRRKASGTESVEMIGPNQLNDALGSADHVINILPENAETREVVDTDFLAAMRPRAIFYNIGRGTTVKQEALIAALQAGHLAAAYLDVTDPEPLPVDDPLWTAPNCFITPHTAGGFAGEEEMLVRHFVENLRRFEQGQPLVDRVF